MRLTEKTEEVVWMEQMERTKSCSVEVFRDWGPGTRKEAAVLPRKELSEGQRKIRRE